MEKNINDISIDKRFMRMTYIKIMRSIQNKQKDKFIDHQKRRVYYATWLLVLPVSGLLATLLMILQHKYQHY